MTSTNITMIKERLKSACQVYRMYPNPQPQGYQSSLDKTVQSAYENTYFFKPTPQEIDDADTIQFQWLPLLTPLERQLLWKRFSGMQWKTLAYDLDISERSARAKVSKALEKLLSSIEKGTIH